MLKLWAKIKQLLVAGLGPESNLLTPSQIPFLNVLTYDLHLFHRPTCSPHLDQEVPDDNGVLVLRKQMVF